MSIIDGLALRQRDVDGQVVPTIEFANPGRDPLCLTVYGEIANSIPTSETGKRRLVIWRIKIASEIKRARGDRTWNSGNDYALTLAFNFHPDTYRRQKLDVENYVKPVVDALTAGLFCLQETEPKDIQKWDYDDSNFKTLLIHRLPDAGSRDKEGVAICVSSR